MRASKRRVLGAVVATAAAVGSLGVATATPASADHAPGRTCHALAEEDPVLFAAVFGTGPGAHGRCARAVAHTHGGSS